MSVPRLLGDMPKVPLSLLWFILTRADFSSSVRNEGETGSFLHFRLSPCLEERGPDGKRKREEERAQTCGSTPLLVSMAISRTLLGFKSAPANFIANIAQDVWPKAMGFSRVPSGPRVDKVETILNRFPAQLPGRLHATMFKESLLLVFVFFPVSSSKNYLFKQYFKGVHILLEWVMGCIYIDVYISLHNKSSRLLV